MRRKTALPFNCNVLPQKSTVANSSTPWSLQASNRWSKQPEESGYEIGSWSTFTMVYCKYANLTGSIITDCLNNKVFLSKDCRMIVTRGEVVSLKQILIQDLKLQRLVWWTPNFQRATGRPIVLRLSIAKLLLINTKFSSEQNSLKQAFWIYGWNEKRWVNVRTRY